MRLSQASRLKLLFALNDLPLLPCAYVTLWSFAGQFTEVPNIWTRGFLGWILPVTFLHCFYLPYLCSAAITFCSLRYLVQTRFPPKDTLIFSGLLLLCLLGLASVETVFAAAMSV